MKKIYNAATDRSCVHAQKNKKSLKKKHSKVHWLEDNQKMMDGTVSKEQSQLL